jgi:probable HAF family extracellular repeat protein
MWRRAIVIALSLLSFAQLANGADLEKYVIKEIKVVDLGTLGGDESVANDINDVGEIAGWSRDSAGKQRAFIYRNGGMQTLLGLSNDLESVANGINNHARIVGYFADPAHNTAHAFYWGGSSWYTQLHEAVDEDPSLCATGARAKAINDYGVIVGIRKVGCNPPDPFIERAVKWSNYKSAWTDLMPHVHAPVSFYAHDVNDNGVIVGEETVAQMTSVGGFTWEATTVGAVPFPPPSATQWYNHEDQSALGINESGRIVGSFEKFPLGYGTEDEVTRAFWWSGSALNSEELPIFPDTTNSTAYELNKNGFIVGYADRKNSSSPFTYKRAVVWHPDFGIAQLPPLSILGRKRVSAGNCEAYAVNDRNDEGVVQAVGYCRIEGKQRALRWDISTVVVSSP